MKTFEEKGKNRKKLKSGEEKEKETDRRLNLANSLRGATPPIIGGLGSSRMKNSSELKMTSSSKWKLKNSPKVEMKNRSKWETKSAALKHGAGTSAIPSLPSPSRKRRGPGHR